MTACTHAPAACCWLCSDDVPWWREARIRAGLGAEPPNREQRPCVCRPGRPCLRHYEERIMLLETR